MIRQQREVKLICLSEDEYDTRHGLSRRERLQRDPDYADWLLEQEKDRRMEKEDAEALKKAIETAGGKVTLK